MYSESYRTNSLMSNAAHSFYMLGAIVYHRWGEPVTIQHVALRV